MDILASLKIRRVSGSELPQRLLLAADESREAVADYVDRGWCYGAFLAGRMVGEYVLLHTRPFSAEVVNIAVEPAVQRQGIGGAMLRHAAETARASGFRKLEIGTGNSGFGQMALYIRCGFRMEWIDRGFFSLHYPEPILEAGLPCTDMVRMGMLL